jgi:uncharacterized protein YndB with AHSA1/START domain
MNMDAANLEARSANATAQPAGPSMSKNPTKFERVSDLEMVMERTFNGPPHLVFAAWTKPELVRKWWAPQACGASITECTADVRVGGKYRYVMRQPDGNECGFSGEYTEIAPPSRLVYTQIFEPMAEAGAVLVTVTFEAKPGGKTFLTSREVYPSKEALDAAVSCGMTEGALETIEQLEALLATLPAQ